jgi:hypothetical protein
MVHLVTFTSSQFDVAAETPNPINPIAGKASSIGFERNFAVLAMMLRRQG